MKWITEFWEFEILIFSDVYEYIYSIIKLYFNYQTL